jgi:solute carrier family 25 phosphate transporter 3
MEAAKVRIQTQPELASTLPDGMSIIYKEGLNGFYKGLVPLWMWQIPSTMMEFGCWFKKTVELLYRYVVLRPRNEGNLR